MRVQYRISSMGVLVAVGVLFASAMIPGGEAQRETAPTGTGAVTWNPCFMWEHVSTLFRMAALLLFWGAFLTHLIQGFRNRPAPWWLSIAGLLAMIPAAYNQLWWLTRCSTTFHLVGYYIWLGATAAMFIHHTIQRQPATRTGS